MAGEWIKWTKGLAQRREVVILASMLQRDRHEIAARLMVLWEWCDDNTADDDADEYLNVSLNLGGKPFEFLDALLGLPGMAEAMASPGVRWLEARSGGRVVFPKLARHNGTSAKSRAYEAAKKRNQRNNLSPVPKNVPEMSPKLGDKIGTRGEERREDLKDRDPPNPPTGGMSGADPPAVTIPAELDTEAFRIAWGEWKRERSERKTKAYTPRGEMEQLKRLAQHGPAKSIEAIRLSIANGWQGVFPERIGNANSRDTSGDVRPRGRVVAPPGKYDHLTAGDPQVADPPQGSNLFGASGNIAEPGGSITAGSSGAEKTSER